jgi:hypothetical protein
VERAGKGGRTGDANAHDAVVDGKAGGDPRVGERGTELLDERLEC